VTVYAYTYGFRPSAITVDVSTSRPGSLSGFRRCSREGRETKVVSAVRAKHDSVGHLLKS